MFKKIKNNKITKNIDKLVMGAIIGAAIGSVVGASLRSKGPDEQKKLGEEPKKKRFFLIRWLLGEK